MISAMAFLMFLWLSAVHAKDEWPCNAKNTFEAASYVKTEDELNGNHENLRAYFPPFNDLPSTISDHSVPDLSIKYPGPESVHLDPDGQEVHLKIPIELSARGRLHSSKGHHTTKKHHGETVGCDGTGHVLALVVLRASFQLGSASLTWLPPDIKGNWTGGECLQLPELKNDTIFHRVADKLQAHMSESWGQGPQKRHVLDLQFGARLFLEFSTPQIAEVHGACTISGSISACVQDGRMHSYVIEPWQRSKCDPFAWDCGGRLPSGLVQDHSAFRMSTLLFKAILSVQARHFKHYNSTFLDSNFNYNLEIGEIWPNAGSEVNVALDLQVAKSSTIALCDGRANPLLSASLDHFKSSGTMIGEKAADGSLSLFTTISSDKSWQGLRLQTPSIPVATPAAQSVVDTVFVPQINQHLKNIALVLPRWLVALIPCELQDHRLCSKLRWKQHGGSESWFDVPLSYVDVVQVSAKDEVKEESLVAAPSLPKLPAARPKFVQLEQGHLTLAILLVTISWFLWVWLAWKRASPKYAVSAVALSMLLWCWVSHSPFEGFTTAALSGFSVARLNSVRQVAAQIKERTDWGIIGTFIEFLILPFWPDLFDLCWPLVMNKEDGAREKDQVAYWCFSALVITSQFWLLVGMPMTLFLGHQLGTAVQDDSLKFPSSALHLIEAFASNMTGVHDMTGTIASCSFTFFFVSFLGLYLIFFLLAFPVGAFLGAVGFVVRYGAEGWSGRIANRIALCVLITELLSTAASLGPFIIAYQILGGNVQWWLALGLVGVFRPVLAMPYTKSDVFTSRACTILVGLAYVGISLVGAMFLWQSFNGALSSFTAKTTVVPAFDGRLSSFPFAVYGVNVWFVGSSACILLHDTVHAAGCSCRFDKQQIEKVASHQWWKCCSSCIEHMFEIPCMEKLLHMPWIAPATLKRSWEDFFPWLVWFLKMEVLVSFLYHCCKVCQLGFETSFFNANFFGWWWVFAWLFESDQDPKLMPTITLDGTDLSWQTAVPIFTVCCLVSWVVLLYAHAGCQAGRFRRVIDIIRMRVLCLLTWTCFLKPFRVGCAVIRCLSCIPYWLSLFRCICRAFPCSMCCLAPAGSPKEGFGQTIALDEAILNGETYEEEKTERAISNFTRLCRIKPDLAQVKQSWAGLEGWANCEVTEEEGEYRKEFLLFGLLHGLLGFLRGMLWRESFPHTWGILGSQVAQKQGLNQFYHDLSPNYGLTIDGEHTILNLPFPKFDWYMSLSLAMQFLLWILVFAALLCELRNRKNISQTFSFMAGAVAIVSGLSVLVPNYARLTNFQEYFRGCGPDFDRFMEFAVSGVLVGLQVFCILVTIPISAVRGLWFVTIRPYQSKNRTLHAGIWLVAFLIPFVTAFPLLFFCQLTKDEWSQGIIYQFWLFPSLTIIAAGKSRGETWFYCGWLVVYCGLVASFMYRQSQIMKIDMQTVVQYLDLPWVWSAMHSDFCLTSVIITDLVCLVLGNEEGDEDTADIGAETEEPDIERSQRHADASSHSHMSTGRLRNGWPAADVRCVKDAIWAECVAREVSPVAK